MSAILAITAAAVSVALSCEGPVNPDGGKPKAISVSTDELVFTSAEAAILPLTITSPARPTVGVPSYAKGWLSFTDGVYDKYQVTVAVKAAANETFSERSAVLTITCPGAESVNVKVTRKVEAVGPSPGDAEGLASFFGLGWNLGNQFDAFYSGSWAGEKEGYPGEEAWGNPKATQATFDGVKSLGFTSVRIPVSWLRMIGPAPDYKIDGTWMDRVYEVVQFAHNSGLKVIINTHHDENHGATNDYQWLDIMNAAGNSALNESIKAKIKAVWTQIAERFADCDDWLLMESFNELNDGRWGWSDDFRKNPNRQAGILNEWNQVFVDAVRATGGKNAGRWLGVPSYCANPEFTKYMTIPEDPAKKIAVSVHFYDPSSYTIGDEQYSDWGHTGAKGKKAEGSDEDHVQNVFGALYNNYVAKGIPVYIGEFGCSMRAKTDTRAWSFYLYYLEYIVKAARTYNLPCFLWDNGAAGAGKEKHGYIDHGTGQPVGNSKAALNVMKRAWFTDSADYTLNYVYSTAPKI